MGTKRPKRLGLKECITLRKNTYITTIKPVI